MGAAERSLISIGGVSGGFVEGREGERSPLNPRLTILDGGESPLVAI